MIILHLDLGSWVHFERVKNCCHRRKEFYYRIYTINRDIIVHYKVDGGNGRGITSEMSSGKKEKLDLR